jgi:hypothetical protein
MDRDSYRVVYPATAAGVSASTQVRSGDDKKSVRCENARQLRHETVGVDDVLDDVGCDNHVELSVGRRAPLQGSRPSPRLDPASSGCRQSAVRGVESDGSFEACAILLGGESRETSNVRQRATCRDTLDDTFEEFDFLSLPAEMLRFSRNQFVEGGAVARQLCIVGGYGFDHPGSPQLTHVLSERRLSVPCSVGLGNAVRRGGKVQTGSCLSESPDRAQRERILRKSIGDVRAEIWHQGCIIPLSAGIRNQAFFSLSTADRRAWSLDSPRPAQPVLAQPRIR